MAYKKKKLKHYHSERRHQLKGVSQFQKANYWGGKKEWLKEEK